VTRWPRLHVVTDPADVERPDFVARASAVIEAGAARVAFHLRAPHATGRLVHERAVALAPVARAHGALLLVNDRVDVALTAGLDGAHLGERSISVTDARTLLGASRTVGASVHDAGALRRARDDGANYAFVGTIYATPSHPGRAGIGPAGLRAIIDEVPGVPVLAIGGLGPGRVPAVLEAGAHGVAVIRGVWSAPDPPEAVLDYLAALESPSTEGL
jgi:thiamine-phosphate pyrophosphorylase